uniref:ATP-binding protein n=1 Tax=Streptomyces sp. NRRL WC-3742 TaxID=1463934 RepID=UPI0004C481E1
MDIWWTLHLKRDPASVPLARRILLGAMATAGVDPQIAHDLGVALTEACANAVEHGACGRPEDGFQVTASISGDRLRIEVTDSGPGLPAPAAPRSRRPAAAPEAAATRPAPYPRPRRG